MEDIKQPEGQAAPAPQGQPAQATEKAANLNQAVERAAESANSAPAKQDQGQPEDWEWDGNPNTLPPQFAKYGKGIQRHFTKRSMQDADLRKAAIEYQDHLKSEEYKQFQEYKKSLGQPAQAKAAPNVPSQPVVTQQEYEEALLDGSGAKFAALVEKVADSKIRASEEKYSGTVSQLQQQTQTAQWNAALGDFADLHPEAVEYHNMGLMEPIVKEELNSGKHRSYESVLNAALERVEKSVSAIRQQEIQRSQGRVVEKKAAVVNTGTAVGDFTVVETDKDSAFEKAFEFAAQNKKVKVRSKR
jgi:hypothetical protein